MSTENVQAAGISAGVLASYLVLYSGYDKGTKNLDMNKVVEIVAVKKSLLYTAQQVNKVLGLGGLTIAGLGMIPHKVFDGCQKELVAAAMALVSLHAGLSSYLFYKCNPVKMIKGEGKSVPFEVPALVFGTVGFYGMCDSVLKGDVRTPAAYASLFLALLHFYFIETPTGLPQDLPCRPYAYTSVGTSVAALSSFGFGYLVNYFKSYAKF